MHLTRKALVFIALAVVIVAGLTFGLVKANAQTRTTLPPLTPAQVLAQVVDKGANVSAFSGELAWSNTILGQMPIDIAALGGLSDGPAAGQTAGLQSLLSNLLGSGHGRIWFDGHKFRAESIRSDGDTNLIFDGIKLGMIDAAQRMVTEYDLSKLLESNAKETTDSTAVADQAFDPARIESAVTGALQKLAPIATVEPTTQGTVAGRECYVLVLTPTASSTVFGSAQIEIDGKTFLPLRIQIFSKADTKPVLSLGFSKIEYGPVDTQVFSLTPPAGYKVQQGTLPALGGGMQSAPKEPTGKETGAGVDAGEKQSLSVEQASAEAGFVVLAPQATDQDLAFQGARVMDMPTADGSSAAGKLVLLRYGQGFGTVVLVETDKPPAQLAALQAAAARVPLLQTVAVNGQTALQFGTSLGGVLEWQQGGLTLLATGSVSSADLVRFAADVR
jgi:hypothetical protein